jgi:hypothetical protein
MASSNNSSSGGKEGIGFTGALQIAFIVLKLCKVIGWSWVWVLAPTWIGLILVVIVAICAALLGR